MTIETDAQNVTNAYLSVISAINTYNANPNATNLFNLAASLKGGAAAVSALLTNNTTLNELQGAFGVNASLASFAKAIADLTTAINNNDVKGQIDATLSGISSLSSAVAGVAQLGAAEFAPLEVVAAAATVASLGATRMQSAYDSLYWGRTLHPAWYGIKYWSTGRT